MVPLMTYSARSPSHLQLPDADPVEFHGFPRHRINVAGKLNIRADRPPPPPTSSPASPRGGRIYFRPAYFFRSAPQLPVMVLLAWAPELRMDWLTAVKLGHIGQFAADPAYWRRVFGGPRCTGIQFRRPVVA